MANVRIQNPREFTLQIHRSVSDGEIVGTGFVISENGLAVTCVHVVKAVTESVCQGVELGVYFALSRQKWLARVIGCFEDCDDDVVLLQLGDENKPFFLPDKMQPARLDGADDSIGNRFRSYGYRPLEKYSGGLAEGKILGDVEPPNGYVLRCDPIQLESSQINSGMSGAAVLDLERDRVVGIISETWFPDATGKDRDTAWAVNVRVLALPPIALSMSNEDGVTEADTVPMTTAPMTDNIAMPKLKEKLVNAPPILDEWVGRVELLQALDEDWGDPARRIVELIGFGGEGKSSVARRWVENVLSSNNKPQAVFWWGFYENGGIDEFFEALAEFLVGDLIDISEYKSASEKIRLINSVLRKGGRYLFVLDGLEVLQHESGDDYGLLKSPDLREWLRTLAKGENEAFCVVTSRAPLFDLIDLTTFVHRDVERLTDGEGCELLQKLGVRGEAAVLRRVVRDWDGYALVLSLLGTYLVERFAGDVRAIREIAVPLAREGRYDRVRRVLRRYDEHLSEAEREVMECFSAFRLPVKEAALSVLGGANGILNQLVNYRMLRYDNRLQHYTTHPLIRAHYLERLKEKPIEVVQAFHNRIKKWYLDIAGEMPEVPTLDQLAPLIEAVHHACQVGEYDEAYYDIYWERIDQKTSSVLAHKLSAYETYLALMQEFFPQGDTFQDPQVSQPSIKAFILNAIALCLMSLGRLREATPFYERKLPLNFAQSDWKNASMGYQNLAGLYTYLGGLTAIAESAREAIVLSDRAENKDYKSHSLAYLAYAAFLQGDGTTAGESFQQAEALDYEIYPSKQYLYSLWGIQHAEYLLRYGEADYARRVTEANLEICKQNNWLDKISQSHRVLGDLGIDPQVHYAEALKIARSISLRAVLIEALLGYGRWLVGLGLIPISQDVLQAILHSQTEQCYMLSLRTNENPRNENDLVLARQYLDEALTYATTSGYRIYEANLRIALAWLHWREGDRITARREADRAKRASDEMGYFWGRVDSAALITRID
ncbi:S1 family peptidase [Pseudanabaena sp. Chao 1811]|uniref:S1 family peptidase n=1 Tax=Pseudanabaena sp. Chao 1811 TaxID=2963092 RepID=UPI0022F39411|nr:serine protease [Pseudanabaena sp. Chao 1811]